MRATDSKINFVEKYILDGIADRELQSENGEAGTNRNPKIFQECIKRH